MNAAPPHYPSDKADTTVQPLALAHQYRRLAATAQPAWLHQEVGRRLADKMQVMRMQPQHWLDWCAWLGGGCDAVSSCYPQAKRWVWEPLPVLAAKSEHAIRATEKAQKKGAFWRHFWQTHFGQHTVAQSDLPWPLHWPKLGVDLLWANMALHSTVNLPHTMKRWHDALAPQGFLMCSGLGPDTAKELKTLYQQMGWPVPAASFLDMHDVGDTLIAAGFAEPVMDMEFLTLTWPNAQDMLDELRTWGGNVAMGRMPGCRTPRWRERLLNHMTEHLRTSNGRLALTVEVIYGHAIKPSPRIPVALETKISLAAMRQLIRRKPTEST